MPTRRPRFVSHAAALAAVSSLVVVSAFIPSRAPAVQGSPPPAATERPEGTADPAAPAQVRLEFGQPALAPAAAVVEPAAGLLNAPGALPHWVRTTAATALFATAGPDAQAVADIPPDGYLKPLGSVVDGRLQVYFAGDSRGRPATQAWVDARAVVPSGVPSWLATPGAEAAPLLASPPRRVSDASPPPVSAWHVAIVDEDSGSLLYGESPYTRVPQASTTKIATAIVALERGPELSTSIKVTVNGPAMAARDGSSVMGLEPGEIVSLRTLLYGLMLPSGNDAAEQLALSVGGTRERFVDWMNDEVAALGLRDTRFTNPSGMDANGHYSSAYDMALLARYAMRNEAFRALAAAPSYAADGYSLGNLNRLLSFYNGSDGVKIGYTDLAQKTIVASVTRNGHRVYVALMRSNDLWTDSARLFDWVWDTFTW
jgi:D-alanyl-D-alanine carboxypeptidase